MSKRKGLGRGLGQGYKNLLHKDPVVHSMSARGIKQKVFLKPVDRGEKLVSFPVPKNFKENLRKGKGFTNIGYTVYKKGITRTFTFRKNLKGISVFSPFKAGETEFARNNKTGAIHRDIASQKESKKAKTEAVQLLKIRKLELLMKKAKTSMQKRKLEVEISRILQPNLTQQEIILQEKYIRGNSESNEE